MGTLLVGAVLVAVIAAAVYKLRKDKKKAKDAAATAVPAVPAADIAITDKKFAYTFSIKAGRTKVLPVLF